MQNGSNNSQGGQNSIPFGFSMGADTTPQTRQSRFNRASVSNPSQIAAQTYATAASLQGKTYQDADAIRYTKAIGREVFFYKGDPRGENGFTENGKIYVNTARANPLHVVVAHELTHTLQNTAEYGELVAAIKESTAFRDYLREHGPTFNELVQRKINTNRKAKPDFDATDAEYEIFANFVGNVLIRNEQHLTELATRRSQWFAKLRELVSRILTKLGVSRAERWQIESIFARAHQAALAAQAQKNPATESGRWYSIVEPFTDNDGNVYDSAVLLDTDFFDGLSPRNWGKKLRKAIEKRASVNPFIFPVKDENGIIQQLQFANPRDRVTKNGHSNHKVIDELSSTSDNISKLAVIHIDEIVEVSEEKIPYHTPSEKHQWLDQNGWLHRKAYVINAKNGAIYELTLDIAKAADGRHILYATNGKIKRVGNVQVNSLKAKGSGQNSNSAYSIPDSSEKSNPPYSIPDQVTSTEGAVDSEELHDIDPQRIRDAIAGKTRGVVDVRGLDTPMRSVSVDELIAASRAGMRRERYVPAQTMDTESAANSEARSMSPDEAAETTRDADVERLRLDTAVGERYNQNADVIAEKIGAVEREVEQQQQNVNAVASPTRIKCINEHLKGTRHRKTNVAFVERIVAIDGQKYIVVAPEFDSVFDTWLPESMRYERDRVQFRECNRRLYEQIASNPGLKVAFTNRELAQISRGITPKRFTWHHDIEVGKMQLILTEIHKKTGHKGGRALWGGGKEYR